MRNSQLSMTKEVYFEMCEQLGSEPIESEIPVDFDDFPIEVQQALLVYRMLRDEWEGMNGIYLGKSLLGIQDIMEAIEIDYTDRKYIVTLIRVIDGIRSEILNTKQQQKPAK
jgi:hypothetical protein